MNRSLLYLLMLPTFTTSQIAVCADADLEKLRQQCQEAREARIAPLREKAIEDCLSERRSTRTREDCERIYSDFGEAGATAGGGFRQAMFSDLPECVAYVEAKDKQRQ